MESLKTIIFIGCQGSGKGTQAQRLREYMEKKDVGTLTFLFSMGGKFREVALGDGYTESRIDTLLKAGKILPVFLPVWLWTRMFINHVQGKEHIIFDGSPRTHEEAEALESAFNFYSREKVLVLNLEVSRGEIIERLIKRGRSDDTKDAIEERVSWFEKNTVPVLNFFSKNSRYSILSINGEQDPDKVFEDIINFISSA
ncbi:MAG: nucleoside monophosphate kinase [Candidatus Paceibacterota bacterium]